MPIEFKCRNCGRQIRVPDTAAGQQGKCPQCGEAVTVPAAKLAEHEEEFWSEIQGAKQEQPKEEAGHGHGGKKKTDAQILKGYLVKDVDDEANRKRLGIPWENKRIPVFERFWDTAILVINFPKDAFLDMRLSGGYLNPLKFAILGGIIGSFFTALYLVISQAIKALGSLGGSDQLNTTAFVIGLVGMFLLTFFMGLVGSTAGVYLHAIFCQAALKMFKSCKEPFEATFRVVAFVNGAVRLCEIVPAIGPGFMAALFFFSLSVGLTKVHGLPVPKPPADLHGSALLQERLKIWLRTKGFWATVLANLLMGLATAGVAAPCYMMMMFFGWLQTPKQGGAEAAPQAAVVAPALADEYVLGHAPVAAPQPAFNPLEI